ncbi:MAG: YihY/virulence factor BrkB family protein [Acidobacteriota bacterium]|nr:YihY/virulence factor BrkB family protein [Acidobacteriota bacterium]
MFEPLIASRVGRWSPTIRYLSQTEVHVYALAIGASVLLSFFPFLIVMMSLVKDVLHFNGAQTALVAALQDYFPPQLGNEILKNLHKVTYRRFQITSLLLLLFTANGIFEPLEVALNRAWGVPQNRSYLRNQVLSLFMILLCGGLALGSILLTAANKQPGWLSIPLYRLAAIPVTISSLFLVYWLLPNCRVPAGKVLPVAAVVGLGMEGMKYLFLKAWPWLNTKFQNEYGETFRYSVSLIIFTMLSSFLVLAGAEWSARRSEKESYSAAG